jgi:hypothetical protein
MDIRVTAGLKDVIPQGEILHWNEGYHVVSFEFQDPGDAAASSWLFSKDGVATEVCNNFAGRQPTTPVVVPKTMPRIGIKSPRTTTISHGWSWSNWSMAVTSGHTGRWCLTPSIAGWRNDKWLTAISLSRGANSISTWPLNGYSLVGSPSRKGQSTDTVGGVVALFCAILCMWFATRSGEPRKNQPS